MAEKTQFIQGVLGADFMQQKTADNIYMKDIIGQGLADSLELYNNRTLALAKILLYKKTDPDSNSKIIYSDDDFKRIGELETPGNRVSFDVWNTPSPIDRFGAATKMTLESIKKMKSNDILQWHNAKIVADQKLLVKRFWEVFCTKAPSAIVDVIDGKATYYKPFWNDEAGMDTPRPNGQITFDGDHDHYHTVDVADTVDENDLDDLIAHVQEHPGMINALVILWARTGATINKIKDETNYKAVVAAPAVLGNINPKYMDSGTAQALITSMKNVGWNINVRGTWKDAIVVETPDLPANYIVCSAYFGDNSPMNPLLWREHPLFPGLMLYNEHGENPIIGKDAQYRRYLGLGSNIRSAGAVMYTAHGSVWAEPTFT